MTALYDAGITADMIISALAFEGCELDIRMCPRNPDAMQWFAEFRLPSYEWAGWGATFDGAIETAGYRALVDINSGTLYRRGR